MENGNGSTFVNMKRPTYNGGQWTQAKFNSFIKSTLRAGSRKWPPKYQALNAALVGTQVNSATGRMAKHFKCARCAGLFPAARVQVDHIEAIIDPKVGFTNWDDVVYAMFCEQDNLQVLCLDCHKIKTAQEREMKKGK